jgi:predicted DNA-binding transcriptional regulator AlpA
VTDLNIVGLKEIAERLGVKQQTAAAWRHRGLLPPPEGTVSGAPAWQWHTIEAWAKATGRLGGTAEFVADGIRGWRVLDWAEVAIGTGVVVSQVSAPFPQPLEGGGTAMHVRFQAASDGQWYQVAHDEYLRGTGAAGGTASKLGTALLTAAAVAGAIVVLNEAGKQGGSPG